MKTATKEELKIVNDFINLINSEEKRSDRLTSDSRATLHHTFKEVQDLKEFLEYKYKDLTFCAK